MKGGVAKAAPPFSLFGYLNNDPGRGSLDGNAT
jgi:hypothetical protein